ncbi:MAG: hypothetical protein WC891_08915 [Actinomycetota bacterium]
MVTWREFWKQWAFDIFGTEQRTRPVPEPTISPYLDWLDGEIRDMKSLMERKITHEKAQWEAEMMQDVRAREQQSYAQPMPNYFSQSPYCFGLNGVSLEAALRGNAIVFGSCPCCGRPYR